MTLTKSSVLKIIENDRPINLCEKTNIVIFLKVQYVTGQINLADHKIIVNSRKIPLVCLLEYMKYESTIYALEHTSINNLIELIPKYQFSHNTVDAIINNISNLEEYYYDVLLVMFLLYSNINSEREEVFINMFTKIVMNIPDFSIYSHAFKCWFNTPRDIFQTKLISQMAEIMLIYDTNPTKNTASYIRKLTNLGLVLNTPERFY